MKIKTASSQSPSEPRPSLSILEQIDRQHHALDSSHVDDAIREGIYAEMTKHARPYLHTNHSTRHTLRSRGMRPSDSSFARAARRFNIRLYCFAFTYNGSSSVGSEAMVV